MTESEKRIAAEAKASHFEASAKAAEERLRSLLDERNWFYSRFKEELEQNNTDMKKMRQLMEQEKSNNLLANPQQRKKVDVRPPVGLGLAKKNLDVKTEDGDRSSRSGAQFRTSSRSRTDEQLFQDDIDRHRLEPLQEFGEPPDERYQSSCTCDPEIFDYNQSDDCFGEDQKSVSSIDIYENRAARYMRGDNERSNMKNEKKRPLSRMNGSRVCHWKSANGPLSVKVERCSGRDGENTTVLDISPGSSRLDSIDLQFRKNAESPHAFKCQSDDSLDFKENAFEFKDSAGLALENSAQRSHANGAQQETLPSKWKRDTKTELRRMINEQEKTWKIAEDAVEELGRRLELLERYKMQIQDTLGRTKAVGNIDRIFKRLQENLEDCPRGFNSLYSSPIYEEGKSHYNCPIFMEKTRGRVTYKDVCTSPTRPDSSKDSEIEKLKIEVAQLRGELHQRDSKRQDTPKLKTPLQFSPRSPPSPRLPTSRLLVAEDWSPNFLSDFVEKEGISPLHPTTPEVLPGHNEPGLADESFEMKTITINARQTGLKQHSIGEVENCHGSNISSSRTRELDEDNRGWVPIPNDSRESTAPVMFLENGISQIEAIDYRERRPPQEDIIKMVVLNSDEGETKVLKIAVQKLAQIFWEQEEKLKKFKVQFKGDDAQNSPAEEVKNLYLDMLKEMSQQLGNLCRDLHAKTQPNEDLLKQESATHKSYPSERLVHHTEKMDNPAATTEDGQIAQQLRLGYDDTSLFSTNNVKSVSKQSKAEEGQAETMADAENLRAALQAAEKQIEEQMNTNQSLKEKLDSGSQYLQKLQAEHAQEITRKDQSVNYAQQLNSGLSDELSQAETSLVEIKLRYKSLVSTLEQQLEEVKNEALSLHDAVNSLKEEILQKENLVSTLNAEATKHKLEIDQLRGQVEAIENDTSDMENDKLELLNCLEGMRRELDEQQHRVKELISINEDLIAFSESKEDEISELKITIENLQQCVAKKSTEAAKLTAETLAFSQEVVETRKEGETYRLRCTALNSKLKEIEHELLAREVSMERLTEHLGKTIEGQDFILEEKEQLLLSLNRAQYKEHRLDDQVRQSKIIIQDLEEKLNSMDAEINEARLEMSEIKARGMEALLMEQEAGEMRNRVHELEEEIMEKEGQISILKTSYPGEYTSTF